MEHLRLLSEHRAKAVRNYLVKRGIGPERLVTSGRGEEQPIAFNSPPEGRLLNRRIEFHLTQMADRGETAWPRPSGELSSDPAQLEFQRSPKGH